MSKLNILLILLLTKSLQAQVPDKYLQTIDEKMFKTNEKRILQNLTPESSLMEISTRRNALSYAEIFYGMFENFKANLIIARESDNRGYIISYLRNRINSYEVDSKKIYNSSYGIDILETGINYSPFQEIVLNLNLSYNYFTRGLMLNPLYDIQNKREILFSPGFKYFFSENSIFSATLTYDELNSEFESSLLSYSVNINSIKSSIKYEKIWSEINALSFNFTVFQYTLKYSQNRVLNNIGMFNIKEKFALSRRIVIDLNLEIDVNKKYNPVLSPFFKLYFILKPFDIEIELNRKYNAEYFKDVIKENYFVKLTQHLPPEIETAYTIGINLEILKKLFFRLKSGYYDIENKYIFKEDFDKLYYISNTELKLVKILYRMDFLPTSFLTFRISYENFPYIKTPENRIPYFPLNKANAGIFIDSSHLRCNTTIIYSDIRNYFTASHQWKILKRYITVNFGFLYLITQNFGVKVEGENIVDTELINLANYPEPEKVYRMGLYTKF